MQEQSHDGMLPHYYARSRFEIGVEGGVGGLAPCRQIPFNIETNAPRLVSRLVTDAIATLSMSMGDD